MTSTTAYKATKTPDGLLVESVVMAVTGKVNSRDLELTTEQFESMVTYFDTRVSRGSIGAYVLLDHDGPRVGKIIGLRTVGDTLVGDLLITNTEVAERIENSDLSDISISYFPKEGILVDVSLLDNSFGQLSDVIPPLLVDTKKEFGIEAELLVECRYKQESEAATAAPSLKEKTNMALTPEDIEVIKSLIADAMGGSDDEGDEPVNEEALSKALSEVKQEKLRIRIDGFVSNLAMKGYTNKEHLRKTFSKFGDNTEAMEVEYKRLMEKANDDIKLEMERTYEAPKLEDQLKSEWEAYKLTYKSNMDFATFLSIVKGEGKAELGNKKINYVEGSIKLA